MRHLKRTAALAAAAVGAAATLAASCTSTPRVASTAGDAGAADDVYAFAMEAIDGTPASLAEFRGRTVLIVNTASKCGFTKQYASLEALAQRYRERGFEVLAFPANDFMNQEPGSNEEIREFCTSNFQTTFPLFSKIHVKGPEQAPLYRWLTQSSGFPGEIEWNFTKFLVGPDGTVVARFASRVDPLSDEVTGAVEALLGKS